MQQRESGTINLVIGRSGSGKTDLLLRWIYHQQPSRVIAWDPAQQFYLEDGFVRVDDVAQLIATLKGNKGDARVAYVPNQQQPLVPQFDTFCRAAMLWNLEEPCMIVADELADVTNAGKAPPAWGMMTRTIRKAGAKVWALTQRPQEIDKTILGNLHDLVVFAPRMEKDKQYIVSEIGVPYNAIPVDDHHFVMMDRLNKLTPGRLAPPK